MKRVLLWFGLTALAGLVVSSGQAAVTTNTWMPSSFTFSNVCTGELVAVSGGVHLVMTSTITDNAISGTLHSQFKATGTGLTSGLTYQQTVVFNQSFTTNLGHDGSTLTMKGVINIVAPGGQNNQWSAIFMHTTIDANGNPTSVRFDPPTVDCR